jgi:pilus assembly protein CpaD
MKTRPAPIAVALMLSLTACATDYTKSEAPNTLRVDGAETRVEISFAPGSARFAAGEAARLERLVGTGVVRPADRVTIAAAGPPVLADRRAAALSSALLAYGIVVDNSPLQRVPADHAIVGIGRYAVTLPTCPNWSEPPNAEYTNAMSSNWGCAAAVNLGLMVASPSDLVSGRTLAPADGMPAVTAVQRYLNDRVKNPPQPTATPFAASPAGGGGAGGAGDTGGGAAGGGAPGAGGGTQ